MKLSIIGSREFNDYNLMIHKINELYDIKNITTIVSGGAMGADKLAEKFAKDNDIKIELYLPGSKKYIKLYQKHSF
jgi:predicted Rossmann fold nucleotide-binding protein DprA/Smf involved in DNA uptake